MAWLRNWTILQSLSLLFDWFYLSFWVIQETEVNNLGAILHQFAKIYKEQESVEVYYAPIVVDAPFGHVFPD